MTKYLGLPVNAAAETGAGVDNLILYVHLLMAALFVGWFAYFLYVLFRFRASRNPKASYAGVKHHGSSYLEGLVALVEGVLLIGFAFPLWKAAVQEFPDEGESTIVKVVAQQFRWNARYPGDDGVFGPAEFRLASTANPLGLNSADPAAKDDFIMQNEIVVPVGRPVIFEISSLDVIHSVAIKPMRVAQDAIPGLMFPAWFTPTRIGQYQITCAQLCGTLHYGMKGLLRVISQEDYDAWHAEQVARVKATAVAQNSGQ